MLILLIKKLLLLLDPGMLAVEYRLVLCNYVQQFPTANKSSVVIRAFCCKNQNQCKHCTELLNEFIAFIFSCHHRQCWYATCSKPATHYYCFCLDLCDPPSFVNPTIVLLLVILQRLFDIVYKGGKTEILNFYMQLSLKLLKIFFFINS